MNTTIFFIHLSNVGSWTASSSSVTLQWDEKCSRENSWMTDRPLFLETIERWINRLFNLWKICLLSIKTVHLVQIYRTHLFERYVARYFPQVVWGISWIWGRTDRLMKNVSHNHVGTLHKAPTALMKICSRHGGWDAFFCWSAFFLRNIAQLRPTWLPATRAMKISLTENSREED